MPVGIVVFEDFGMCGPAMSWGRVEALEPVANRAIVLHAIDALLDAGVGEIIAVASTQRAPDVRDCLVAHAERTGLALELLAADAPLDLLGALQRVAAEIGPAPCVVHMANGLLSESLAPLVGSVAVERADVAMAVRATRGPGIGALAPAALHHGGLPAGWESAEAAGVMVFGPGALRRVMAVAVNCPQTSAAGAIAASAQVVGAELRLLEADRWASYAGDPADLLTLNRIALERLGPVRTPPAQDGNELEGRVWLDETARVQSSVIIGPVVIGAGARVSDAYIGPYTSIGAGARIEGAEIERSIVSAGASILHVGGRLVASVVGRDARVFRDFSLPRAMRLRVGDGTEVALC